MKIVKLCFLCLVSVMCLAGCGEKSEIKARLETVQISSELPEVTDVQYRYLSEADEAVYEQQIAACEMFYEAYQLTKTSDYIDMYEDAASEERIASYCNDRRKVLNDEIEKSLRDNVEKMLKVVEDCDNVKAYLDRVVYDTRTFYDYYGNYMYSDNREEAICEILTAFHERPNVLAFGFMRVNKDEFVDTALVRIVNNSLVNNDYNKYILESNEIVKVLNTVYGGVSAEYAEIINTSNRKLIRNMLEKDGDLNELTVSMLMKQLG